MSDSANLIAEANHRVANSLTLLGGLVRMQAWAAGKEAQPFSNAEVRLMLDGVAARIATIGQLHRMLANTQGEGSILLNAHLREVCASLITAFSSEQQPVAITHGGGDCLILARHIQSLTLIVCEIITNALKYSHPANAPVRLDLHCDPRPNGTLVLTISDDGVGLPEDFDPLTDGGLGFKVIRVLCADIDASLSVDSDNLGVTFRLSVPAALVANAQRA